MWRIRVICGIIFMLKGIGNIMGRDEERKVFIVYNTACLGDVLLCNSLIQNIKNVYSDSKVVFVCDKKFKDAALYQEGVDEVVVFDKKGENKGLFGILKFVKNFKYKNPYVSIITYHNERNYIIARLTGSQKVVMQKKKTAEISVQERHNMLLKDIKDLNIQNFPIKYNVPSEILESVLKMTNNSKDYITVCPVSKKEEKDIPTEVCVEIIKKLNQEGINVVFTGAGEKSLKYSEILEQSGCKFVNLVNKTSISELAAVIKNSRLLLSVDTGTMHLGTAVGALTLAVWYEKSTENLWFPNSKMYKISLIDSNQTSENIVNKVKEIY